MARTLQEFLTGPCPVCPIVYICPLCEQRIERGARTETVADNKPAHEDCVDRTWDEILAASGGAIGHGRPSGGCRQPLGPND